jgi:hypothetical protein
LADDGSDIHPHAQTTPDPVAAAAALKFFAWAYAKGDKMAEELDYVPRPKKVVEDIEKVWAREIKDSSGKPLKATVGSLARNSRDQAVDRATSVCHDVDDLARGPLVARKHSQMREELAMIIHLSVEKDKKVLSSETYEIINGTD